jgi:hypothetical protein
VFGGVLGRAPYEFPGGLAEQPADVDLPGTGARSTEEAGEEFAEGVTLRADEAAGHRFPFLR